LSFRRTSPVLAAIAASVVLAQPVGAQEETRVEVTVDDAGCSPTALEVPSGVVVFEVNNLGGDVGEFEILSGDRVVDEVENIVPGFVVNMVTRLDGGEYETVCYTLVSPRGTLAVTGGAAPSAPPSAVVDTAVLERARDDYQAWVNEEAAALVADVDAFTGAILAGDLEQAGALYAPSRLGWERIEPIAELWADLDVAIDAREEDFAQGVDDPAFTGFHRIERLLWVDGASGDLDAMAEKLAADVHDLEVRLADLVIEPRVTARGAGELIDEVAQSKLTGEEDRYSGTDLWSIDANVDGSRQTVDYLRPILESIDADYLADLDAAFAAVDEVIARYADGEGFAPFSDISADDLTQIQARMAGLTEVLAQLPGVLGLAV
jgi:iron uptake system component EfeO